MKKNNKKKKELHSLGAIEFALEFQEEEEEEEEEEEGATFLGGDRVKEFALEFQEEEEEEGAEELHSLRAIEFSLEF